MKFNKKLLKEKWFAYTIAMCSAVILYLVLTHLTGIGRFLGKVWNTGSPIFMAFVIAYILDPLERFYAENLFQKIRRERTKHSFSVGLSILTVVLFFAVLMTALIPQIVDSAVTFARNLNGYVASLQRLMRQISRLAAQHDIDLSKVITSSDEMLQSITKVLPENLNKLVNFSYVFGARLFDWVISFILAIYLMMDSHRMKKGFVRLMSAVLSENAFKNTSSFWKRCNRILLQYIAYDLLDGMIIGLCNWIFMVITNMPYAVIVSVIVGVTNLAPTFGPMAGAIIGAFILVLVKPWHALWFLLFTMVLQTIDGYVIKPRLFGEQLGVSSVWILIALVIGGRFLGVPGILLAIPFAAIGDFIYHDYFISRLEAQKEERLRLQAEAEAKAARAEAKAKKKAETEADEDEDEDEDGDEEVRAAAKAKKKAGAETDEDEEVRAVTKAKKKAGTETDEDEEVRAVTTALEAGVEPPVGAN